MANNANVRMNRKDVQCTTCDLWMGWGTEYYDDNDNPYCPDHRPAYSGNGQ
jgi:hypothetical protein